MSLFGIGAGAVAGIVGNLLGGAMKAHSANAQLEKQAQLQRELWEYQQQHAHQFEVQDLKDAGLNPILSANHSQLANMPSVSTPTGINPLEGISDTIASALELEQRKKEHKDNLEIEAYKQEIEMLKARTGMYQAKTAEEHWKRQDEMQEKDIMYRGMTTASQIRLNEAQIYKINNEIAQGWDRLRYEIEEMKSRTAVNNEQLLLISQNVVKVINESDLLAAQKDDILRSWTSYVRKADELSAKQRYDYLNMAFGQLEHQIGYGLNLLNPFSAITGGTGNVRVGVRK